VKWLSAVDDSISILILNTGSWYNPTWGLQSHLIISAYEEMLVTLKVHLQSFVASGIQVFWVCVPDTYEPDIARVKNDLANKYLSPLGVQIVDPLYSIDKRIQLDRYYAASSQHLF